MHFRKTFAIAISAAALTIASGAFAQTLNVGLGS